MSTKKSTRSVKKPAIAVNVDDLMREVKDHVRLFTIVPTDLTVELDATLSDDPMAFELQVSYDLDICGRGNEDDFTWIKIIRDTTTLLWRPQFRLETPRHLRKDYVVDDVEALAKLTTQASRADAYTDRLYVALLDLSSLIEMLNQRFSD